MTVAVEAFGPGRVNLIGDHTDYNRGLALPIAINLGTDVVFTPNASSRITVVSTAFPSAVDLPLSIPLDADVLSNWEPAWVRLAAGMVAMVRPEHAGVCRIDSSLPIGVGLSSSAALGVALAEVFGAQGTPRMLAQVCQQVEQLAGVPIGVMDPLVCAGARAGFAMRIDFSDVSWEHIPIPPGVDIIVVDSGVKRSLRNTEYAARVAECEAAAVTVGPLGLADNSDVAGLRDPQLHRRARHVVSECARVRQFTDALRAHDLDAAGQLMVESHRSLADDFEASTPELDALAFRLASTPGVYGARLTGGGFGGCVVALTERGAIDLRSLRTRAWRVVPSDGSRVGLLDEAASEGTRDTGPTVQGADLSRP